MLDTVAVASLPTTLEVLRKAQRFSRARLAALTGVHQMTIYRIERGPARGIEFDTLRKLAAFFDVLPHALLARPEDPPDVAVPEALRPPADALEPEPEPSMPPPAEDVLYIRDLAAVLRCSVLTVRRTLTHRPWDLPRPLPSVDKRYRWSRRTVDRWLDGDPTASGPTVSVRKRLRMR